jgi:aa3 type cytochrome c oxidase subunit IV
MADNQMLQTHRQQWHGFVKLMTWSVVFVAVVLVGMAIFLT